MNVYQVRNKDFIFYDPFLPWSMKTGHWVDNKKTSDGHFPTWFYCKKWAAIDLRFTLLILVSKKRRGIYKLADIFEESVFSEFLFSTRNRTIKRIALLSYFVSLSLSFHFLLFLPLMDAGIVMRREERRKEPTYHLHWLMYARARSDQIVAITKPSFLVRLMWIDTNGYEGGRRIKLWMMQATSVNENLVWSWIFDEKLDQRKWWVRWMKLNLTTHKFLFGLYWSTFAAHKKTWGRKWKCAAVVMSLLTVGHFLSFI